MVVMFIMVVDVVDMMVDSMLVGMATDDSMIVVVNVADMVDSVVDSTWSTAWSSAWWTV